MYLKDYYVNRKKLTKFNFFFLFFLLRIQDLNPTKIKKNKLIYIYIFFN